MQLFGFFIVPMLFSKLKRFRLPVAVHAPAHRKAFMLIDPLHLLYWPMTGFAVFARKNMACMREFDKIWQKMDLLPDYWPAFAISCGELLDPGAFALHYPMAVHADL